MKKTLLLFSLLGLTTIMRSQCNLSASITVTNPRCTAGFGSATVTATGGSGNYTYQWSTGAGGNSIAFAYAGVYTATVVDGTCSIVATATVVDPPDITYTYANIGIPCHGGTGSASVSATGGSGTFIYNWSTGSTNQVISGQGPGTYSVTISDTYSCTQSTSFTFIDPPLLVANTSFTSPLCNGGIGTVAVSASGGTTPYNYSLSALSFAPVFNGVAPGAYTLITKDANDCTVSNTFTLTQPATLSLTAAASPTSVCAGSTTTLTASGSGGTGTYSYSWTPGSATTSTYAVTPASNTTYTATITDVNGCVATKTVAVVASGIPVITAASGSICAGKSFTMSPSGASTYTYSSGNAVVSPVNTSSYSVVGSSTAGCVSQSVVVNVTVNSNPTITVNSATVCSGTSVAIIPSGASTYTITGGTFTVTPNVNTSYSVTGSANGCTAALVVSTVSVNARPTLSVNNATICSGNSTVITPGGAATYSITGNSYTVTPNATTNYSVTGTGANGCAASNTVVANVLVNITPTLSVNSITTCAGIPVIITPSGAGNYSITANSFTVNPAVTTSYSVTGTANGCAGNTVVAIVVVNANPTITVNSGTICNGSDFMIFPSGAIGYTINGNTFTVSPTTSTNYTLAGININGCVSAVVISSVTVNELPNVTAIASSATICAGETVTLTAQGASTYKWTNYSATASLVVTPSITTVYEVTGKDVNGCKATYTLNEVVDLCLSINSVNKELSGINVYPNPNNGQFVIQSPEGIQLEITNVLGQAVYSEVTTATKTDVSIAHLPNGIYFVKAANNSAQRTVKIVKE